MDNLALELVKYLKEEVENFGDSDDLADEYQRIMYSLEDMECLQTLPERFQDQKVVEDAWSICETRVKLLDPICHYYDDAIPEYLRVTGIKEYFTDLVLYEIEENIEKVFPDNYEYIESDVIESVIRDETLNHCEDLLKYYVEYMKEEYDQDLEVYNNDGDPYIVKYGRINEIAHIDSEKIVEIAETSGSDYFNIEFDWGV